MPLTPTPPPTPRRAPAIGAGLAALGAAPSAAWAAHADFSGLGYALLGGAAGLLGGVALSILLASRRKPGLGGGLLAFGLAIAVTLAMGFAGASVGSLVYSAVKRADARHYASEDARYRNSPVRLAACAPAGSGPAGELEQLSRDASESWLLRLAVECGLEGPARSDVYLTMMRRLNAQPAPKSGDKLYCVALGNAHRTRALPQLQALVDAGLPWDCPQHDGTPGWWLSIHPTGAGLERDLQWLATLRAAGARLGQRTPAGAQLLDTITRCHAPAVILRALEDGADPGLLNPLAIGSPRVQWALRRHAPPTEDCSLQRFDHPLDRAAVGQIDARIGAPSEHEVNAQNAAGQTALFSAYGDARTLGVLLRAGARIDILSNDGQTFLHNARKLTPDALALLAAQPAERLQALGRRRPSPAPGGRAARESLVDVARQRGDTGLETLLCAHGADGC